MSCILPVDCCCMAPRARVYPLSHRWRGTRKAKMTSIVHALSHSSLAQCAAAGVALLPETHGVRVTGALLEVWNAEAPVDAIQCALDHVQAAWRGRKERALSLWAAADNAQAKVARARTAVSKEKAREICEVAWADYSRACGEVDATEARMSDLRALLSVYFDFASPGAKGTRHVHVP